MVRTLIGSCIGLNCWAVLLLLAPPGVEEDGSRAPAGSREIQAAAQDVGADRSRPADTNVEPLAAAGRDAAAEKSSLADTLDPAIGEILRIRQRQGAVVGSSILDAAAQADSSQPPASAQAEFAAALQRIASRDGSAPLPPPVAATAATPRLPEMFSTSDQQLVDVLREVSRRLDLKSHDFEARRAFERADEIRRLARRVRRQARLLEQGR